MACLLTSLADRVLLDARRLNQATGRGLGHYSRMSTTYFTPYRLVSFGCSFYALRLVTPVIYIYRLAKKLKKAERNLYVFADMRVTALLHFQFYGKGTGSTDYIRVKISIVSIRKHHQYSSDRGGTTKASPFSFLRRRSSSHRSNQRLILPRDT